MCDEKTSYQMQLFSNRLARKYKQLRKWARRQGISCYRLYDRDIPEVPLAADLYEFLPDDVRTPQAAARFFQAQEAAVSANDGAAIAEAQGRHWLHLFLYERPYAKDAAKEATWLEAMAQAARDVLHLPRGHVVTKLRKRQKGASQYEKLTELASGSDADGGIGRVQECGLLFKVNLRDYLDTGLFLDHRPLRGHIRAISDGKAVLNLFCYTGSFSVYAAAGGASRVDSVDLSNTYLAWAKENMALNGVGFKSRFIRSDVVEFLAAQLADVAQGDRAARYDIIMLDPPTFSNSKATAQPLDINRDWASLCTKCLHLLNAGGTLYFSTNSRQLAFDRNLLPHAVNGCTLAIDDISEQTLPEDFGSSRGTKSRRCWKLQLAYGGTRQQLP